jgi:hypothetical protein
VWSGMRFGNVDKLVGTLGLHGHDFAGELRGLEFCTERRASIGGSVVEYKVLGRVTRLFSPHLKLHEPMSMVWYV